MSGEAEREATQEGAWIDEHGDALFRYALLRVGDREAAEELVQETFLAGLESRGGFEGRSAIRTWLIGILKHKIADRHRRQARERTVEPGASDEDVNNSPEQWFDERGMWRRRPASLDLDPTAHADRVEFWRVLTACLEELPARQREAFSLRELDERPTQEAAEAMAVKPNNLWVMLHRARARLRSCLEKRWLGGEKETS
jgi:RNA polymerase sigma-70 factor (ECF subfamily)